MKREPQCGHIRILHFDMLDLELLLVDRHREVDIMCPDEDARNTF